MNTRPAGRLASGVRLLAALALCAGSPAALADDKELAQAINGARADLTSGDWRDARDELSKATDHAKLTKDETLRGNYLFYSALAYQQWSEDEKVDAGTRKSARERAIRWYEDFLKTRPDSGGALNNLAQLYAQDPDQRPKAIALLDRAVQLKDDRVGVYAANRARILAESGQDKQALDWALGAVKNDRNDEAAQTLALDLLRKEGDTRRLADYMRELERTGLVQRAVDVGLTEIESRSAGREPLLVAIAEALAHPGYGGLPDRFVKSEVGGRLRKQVEGADIGPGVRELLALHEKPGPVDAYGWWRKDFIDYDELRPGTRSAALLALARALGDRCRAAGEKGYPCAEAYYRFAIDFTGTSADPSAFLALAEVLANTGRGDELAKVSQKYERALFRGKETAYNRRNLPKIYQFHLALGMMYGYLGKWEDKEFAPGGSIWQLNRAKETADRYNADAPEAQRIVFPPQAVTVLSDGYLKTGAVDNSVQIRVEAAEKYIKRGDKERAQEVLDPEWRKSLPATVKQPMRQRVEAAATAAQAPEG